MLSQSKRALHVGAAMVAILIAQNAWAQQAESPQQRDGAPDTEIVVTATRKDEALSKVPISISAFTQAKIDRLGIRSFADAVKFTPGVSFSNDNSNRVDIRGVSSNAASGTTGIYIDDTPIQIRQLGLNSNNTLPAIFDLSRIEVLRGPQGTLFGAGSEGGTVRYILPAPSSSKWSGYARSELGFTRSGDPSWEFGAAGGGPIVQDVLGFRLSGYVRRDGGYIDRVDPYDGSVFKNENFNRVVALQGALGWTVAADATLTPSIMYQERKIGSTGVAGFFTALGDPAGGNFINGAPGALRDRDSFVLPALKIDIGGNGFRVISNTSFFDRRETVNGYEGTIYNLSYFQHSLDPDDETYQDDPVGYKNPLGNPCTKCRTDLYPLLTPNGINPQFISEFGAYRSPNVTRNTQQNWTQELRLQSDNPNARVSWIAGVFYSTIKQKSIEQLIDPQLDAISQYLFGEDILTAWGVPLLPGGVSYENNGGSRETQIAGFADVTFNVTEKLKLNAGLRYAYTYFRFSNTTIGPEAFTNDAIVETGVQKGHPLTPKFNVSYQATSDDLYYATVSKGYRIGGANAKLLEQCALPAAPLAFKSDSLWNYEIGAKNRFFDRRLSTSFSAYYIDWKDIQQSVYIGACGQQFVGNLGKARIYGFDFQANANLAHGLNLDFTVGYTNMRYTQDSLIDTTGTNESGNIAVRNGNTVENPPWQVSAGLQYDFRIGTHDAYARIDDVFQSRVTAFTAVTEPADDTPDGNSTETGTLSSDPLLRSNPTNNQVNLRIGATISKLDLSLFANNLFDSRPLLNLARSDSTTALFTASTLRPRTIGLTASYRY